MVEGDCESGGGDGVNVAAYSAGHGACVSQSDRDSNAIKFDEIPFTTAFTSIVILAWLVAVDTERPNFDG